MKSRRSGVDTLSVPCSPGARHARRCIVLGLLLLGAQPAFGQEGVARLSELEAYPYALGTQTFSAAYQFTGETKLVETAQAMLDMGSNTVKFGMGRKLWSNVPSLDAGIRSLADLAAREPSHKRVLDMPFAHYLIWAYPFATREGSLSRDMTDEELDHEYREMYDLVRHLLVTYRDTGKTFYLGHWEGDWILLGHFDAGRDPEPERIPRMIRWLEVRQKAVDDARRATPRQGVAVYHYTEVNLVRKALKGGITLTNNVLPKTAVDYVSYSSYDSLGKNSRRDLLESLSYIESKLPPKPGLAGKRVFIGEYGFPAIHHATQQQDALSREVMRAGLEWGCRFVLYWQMYNNEIADGKQRGFWLIDDQGARQPVYHTHRQFLKRARQAVAEFHKDHRRLPTVDEYGRLAGALLGPSQPIGRTE